VSSSPGPSCWETQSTGLALNVAHVLWCATLVEDKYSNYKTRNTCNQAGVAMSSHNWWEILSTNSSFFHDIVTKSWGGYYWPVVTLNLQQTKRQDDSSQPKESWKCGKDTHHTIHSYPELLNSSHFILYIPCVLSIMSGWWIVSMFIIFVSVPELMGLCASHQLHFLESILS
jgi:hypothetical protein